MQRKDDAQHGESSSRAGTVRVRSSGRIEDPKLVEHVLNQARFSDRLAWPGKAMWRALLPVLAATLASPPEAAAAEPDYFGAWLITDARVAPWAKAGEEATFSEAEARRLIGSKVIYRKARIEGPTPLACSKPHYRLLDVRPEGLFQGTLTDPVAQAHALGYRAGTIPTLETGCEGWIDFHFVDARTALFALNNRIYTLRKP
jgi:hypothetical protein